MICRAVVFPGPRQVRVEATPPPKPPGTDEVLIETSVSAISAGTELLLYRGQAPTHLAADETFSALAGDLSFPLKYGYAAVGRVVETGPGVRSDWQDREVFAFHPHESHFVARIGDLIPLPRSLAAEIVALLPSMETAVSLLMDGQPVIGEQVIVFGQGVVGLMATLLLAQLPLASLVTVDCHPRRRRLSQELGARNSLDPDLPQAPSRILEALQGNRSYRGADLSFELTGNPAALNQAVAATGYDGRVVIGSWYGTKPVELDLGGTFHRSAMRLIASQVSQLAPSWRGRWTKTRRLDLALQLLEQHRPSGLITHRFSIEEADKAYRLLDEQPGEAVQVLLQYGTAAAAASHPGVSR